MKKLLLAPMCCITLIAFSQNLKKEKVKTSVLSYPMIDQKKHPLESLIIEYASADAKLTGKKAKKTGGLCQSKVDKKIVKKEVYRYDCSFTNPESYTRIKSSGGEVLFMSKTEPYNAVQEFGEESKKCIISEAMLEQEYASLGSAFISKYAREQNKIKMDNGRAELQRALFFKYTDEDFAVYYPKSKEHDYTTLEDAAETAADGFKALKVDNSNEKGKQKLTQAIAVWEKELEASDVENKDAKINEKVTKALLENIARAYGYLMEYDKALEAISKSIELDGNFSNNKTQERKLLQYDLLERKESYEKNKSMAVNLKTKNFKLVASGDALSLFEGQYKAYNRKPMVTFGSNDDEDSDESTGEGDKYRPLVMDNGTDKTLMIPNLAAGAAGLPEFSKKISEFPAGICDLNDVTSLILKGNKLKEIPSCIGNMSSLKKLNLANNELTSLPEEISQLENLKTLTIKGNNIPQAEIDKIQESLPDCKIKL